MLKNKSWFSIIIWMGLVVLISLSAYVILDYMVPYSKNTKWIENASNAYYNAYGWIEEALVHVKNRWNNLTAETGSNMPTTNIGKSYNTDSSAWEDIDWQRNLPAIWQWNSPYNSNFNIISPYEPIQLEVWKWKIKDFNWFEFFFRVPNFKNWTTLTISWPNRTEYLWWMLSASNDTLIASWNNITRDKIKNSNQNFTTPSTDLSFKLNDLNWSTLTWTYLSFSDFYNTNCNWTNSWCILKISVINKLKLTDWTIIPYLEYNSSPHSSVNNNIIPDRYTTIQSSWKSYMYRKDLKVKIPQQTVNQALDFTVFQ